MALVGAMVLAALTAGAVPAVFPATAVAEDAVCTATECAFVSPTGGIDCVITVGDPTGVPDSASCAWSDEERAQSAKLLPSGALEPCLNLMAAVVDRCVSEDSAAGPASPELGYGQVAALGPFRCLAEAEGITCTTAPSGRGFTINTAGIVPIGI